MKRALLIAGWIALGAAMATVFIAYQQPGVILDNANLRYCG